MALPANLVASLLARLREARRLAGMETCAVDADTRFSDAIDSMGFVEFLTLVADDCGATVEAIEQAAGRRYSTVAELAAALHAARLHRAEPELSSLALVAESVRSPRPQAWLAATTTGLPLRKQSAASIDDLLRRPSGWLENQAGIQARFLWDGDEVLDVAARTAQDCLRRADLPLTAVRALLVTSQAPPLLTGLAAALHHRLGLPAGVAALEIGGACTAFLAALWTAQHLLEENAAVLILAVEAPSRWLTVEPGPAGEAAALFGDATAASVLTAHPTTTAAMPLRDILLVTDGSAASLLRVQHESGSGSALHMDGVRLAQRAVRGMADAVRQMSARHGLTVDQLDAVVAHGGNGRMPALLARRLGLPTERVWSETTHTGNLGSASLPVAWVAHTEPIRRSTIWTAIGAGLQGGAALFGAMENDFLA